MLANLCVSYIMTSQNEEVSCFKFLSSKDCAIFFRGLRSRAIAKAYDTDSMKDVTQKKLTISWDNYIIIRMSHDQCDEPL